MEVRRSFVSIFIGLIVIALGGPARAVTLSLDPSAQEIAVGGTATVDLNISGLESFAAPSLGAFFAEITFSDTILAFDSVMYGSFLGSTDLFDFETDIATTVAPGSVSLDEISLLLSSELDALQTESFTLATLNFSAIGVGVSNFGFGTIDLSDAALSPSSISPDAIEAGNVTVRPQRVPEPSSLLLVVAGLMLWVASQWWFTRERKCRGRFGASQRFWRFR